MLIQSFFVPTHGFAGKKPKPRKPKTKQTPTHKGFGKAPLTVEETISAFKTRQPKIGSAAASRCCPCRAREDAIVSYADCCMPLHNGDIQPTSPTAVLRSRYSAFAFRIIPYIMDTTHPTCSDYREKRLQWAESLNADGMFDSYKFDGLTILSKEEFGVDENEAFLEFQVHLREKKVDGRSSMVKERSRFLRDTQTGVWSYSSGDLSVIPDG